MRSGYTRDYLKASVSKKIKNPFYVDLEFLNNIVKCQILRKKQRRGNGLKQIFDNCLGHTVNSNDLKTDFLNTLHFQNLQNCDGVDLVQIEPNGEISQNKSLVSVADYEQPINFSNTPSKSEEIDYDKCFLLSLLEEFRHVPTYRKMTLKIDLLERVKNAQDAPDLF